MNGFWGDVPVVKGSNGAGLTNIYQFTLGGPREFLCNVGHITLTLPVYIGLCHCNADNLPMLLTFLQDFGRIGPIGLWA